VGLTCDQDLELLSACLAAVDNLHDAVEDLEVEAAGQPALHEAHMHHWARTTEGVAPCWGVGHPPSL